MLLQRGSSDAHLGVLLLRTARRVVAQIQFSLRESEKYEDGVHVVVKRYGL